MTFLRSSSEDDLPLQSPSLGTTLTTTTRLPQHETQSQRLREPEAFGSVRSMTGQGTGRSESALGVVTVELRSVNQRGLKISPRLSDSLAPLESRFEQWIRTRIQRGTVHANAGFAPSAKAALGRIQIETVIAYARQLRQVQETVGGAFSVDLTGLLTLPGAVVTSATQMLDPEPLWEMLAEATDQAMEAMDAMRLAEGEAMAAQIRAESVAIANNLGLIGTFAPRVVENYRQRLETKINRVLSEHGLEFSPSDLLRDIQLYADRSDISEEITRLGSHLKMFDLALQGSEASGRKLDFIVQEMFRETNTIGSKAADAEISAIVVDIKCAIERMRELVQNIQ